MIAWFGSHISLPNTSVFSKFHTAKIKFWKTNVRLLRLSFARFFTLTSQKIVIKTQFCIKNTLIKESIRLKSMSIICEYAY